MPPTSRQTPSDPRTPDTTVDKGGDQVEPLVPAADAEPTTPADVGKTSDRPVVTGSTFAERKAIRLGQAVLGVRNPEGKVIGPADAENK